MRRGSLFYELLSCLTEEGSKIFIIRQENRCGVFFSFRFSFESDVEVCFVGDLLGEGENVCE